MFVRKFFLFGLIAVMFNFSMAQASDYDNFKQLNDLGTRQMNSQQHNEAIATFEKALKLNLMNTHKGVLYFNIAQCYDALNNYDAALENYKKSIECMPLISGAHLMLGLFYEDHKKYDDALKCYKKVLELAPDEVYGYLAISCCYSKIDTFESWSQVKEITNRWIEKHPKSYAEIYWQRGMANYFMGHAGDALKDLKMAQKLQAQGKILRTTDKEQFIKKINFWNYWIFTNLKSLQTEEEHKASLKRLKISEVKPEHFLDFIMDFVEHNQSSKR